jgi:NADH-quinone oxidoreductase subunit K
MIGLQHYLTVSAMLFVLSIAGIIINRKNLILLLMCIELMLLAVNTNFIAFSRFLGDETGQVFVFFILTVAAAEAAIGLASGRMKPETVPGFVGQVSQTESLCPGWARTKHAFTRTALHWPPTKT